MTLRSRVIYSSDSPQTPQAVLAVVNPRQPHVPSSDSHYLALYRATSYVVHRLLLGALACELFKQEVELVTVLVDNVASSHVRVTSVASLVDTVSMWWERGSLSSRAVVSNWIICPCRTLHSWLAQFSACLPVCATEWTFSQGLLRPCRLDCRCGAQAPRGASHSTDLSSPAVRMLGIFCETLVFAFSSILISL